MVVLSKLATGFYKNLGFKNRTTGANFIKYVLQVTSNKYKTEKEFEQYLTPKISNLSSLGIDINDKKSSNAFKILKDIKKLESKKGKKKQEQIEKKLKELEKSISKGTWHISGTIKIKEDYNKVSKRGKEYIYHKEEKDGIIHKGTKDEAINEFKRSMMSKYEKIDPSPNIIYTVESMDINSITQVDDNVTNKEDIPMKNASQLEYNIIGEYKEFLQNTGTCVIDNFIGMYGQDLKLTRENFINMCKDYYKQYNIDWTVGNGISPKCVNCICEQFDISHYAFDISKKCFVKNISKNRNHKALIYFAVNNHMYLILEDSTRKSLIEKTKVKENFNTSLLENEEEKENSNIYDNYNIVVNVSLDNIFQESKDTIYMFSREGKTNINDIFIHMLTKYGVPQDIKCKKTKIVGFRYKIEGIDCGLKFPHKYDKYGNKLDIEYTLVKIQETTFKEKQNFINKNKIENIVIEEM